MSFRFPTKKITAPRYHSAEHRLTVVQFAETKIKLQGNWIDAVLTFDEDDTVYVFTQDAFDKSFEIVGRRVSDNIEVPCLTINSLKLSPNYIHISSSGRYALFNGLLCYFIESYNPERVKIYVAYKDHAIYVRKVDDFDRGFELI